MSTSKNKYCDCCGAEIPYRNNRTHMEYDGWTTHAVDYRAGNDGNKDFCYHSPKDWIYGMVSLNMNRAPEIETVVESNYFDGARCKDICPKCKIKFLEKCIEHLKRYEV